MTELKTITRRKMRSASKSNIWMYWNCNLLQFRKKKTFQYKYLKVHVKGHYTSENTYIYNVGYLQILELKRSTRHQIEILFLALKYIKHRQTENSNI